ncbi:MAG: TonB-dependent receptor [Bacteroidia bacterium]
MNIRLLIFSLLLGTALAATAQPGSDPLGGKDTIVLENERINDVIESEKPFIKPPYQTLEKGAQEGIRFESQSFYVETDFTPQPPNTRPVETIKEDRFNNNLLRLGIGRYVTPLAQLYLNNGKEGDIDYGLMFTHRSAHQDEIPLREFREDYGTLRFAKIDRYQTFSGTFDLYNTQYFFYAGDDTLRIPGEQQLRSDSLRMGYTNLSVRGRIQSNYVEDPEFTYDAGVDIRFLGDQLGNQEFHLDATPTGGYYVASNVLLGLRSQIAYVRGSLADVGQNRFFLDLHPGVTFDNGTVYVHGGIRYNYFRNSVDSSGVNNLGPMIEARYAVQPDQLVVMAGYTSGMVHNHYYDMRRENRYLGRAIDVKPTVEKMNIYLGAEGNITEQLDYAAKLYYRRTSNQLIYRSVDSIYFQVVYDSLMTTTGGHIELNYDLDNNIRAGAALNINVYSTSNQDSLTARYFHAAPLRLDFYGAYTWNDQLTAKAELFVFGPTPMGTDATGELIRRNPFLNLNVSADFRITKDISVFLTMNNVLNSRYERWLNYPERRFDVLGGLTVAF